MKRSTASIAAAALIGIGIFTPTPLRAAVRTWTDSTGKHKVEAEFVSLEGETVSLKTPAGKMLTLELGKLSEPDRAIAKDLAGGVKPAGAAAPEVPAAATDVQTSAKGSFMAGGTIENGVQKSFVDLKIEVTLVGGVAANAYSVGPVTADSLTLDGKLIKAKEGIMAGDFKVIDRSAEGFLAIHPKDGIKVEVTYGDVPNSTTAAGPLTGKVKVLTGGTAKTLEIKDLLTRPTTVLSDPQLAAVGLVAKFTRSIQGDIAMVGVELGGKGAEAFAGIELVAADGTKLKGGSSNMSAMGQVSYARDAKLAEMKGAKLKLNFREGGKLVVIPFNLPEVKVGN